MFERKQQSRLTTKTSPAFAFLLLFLPPFLLLQSICSPRSSTCVLWGPACQCIFPTFTTRSDGVSRVRIVNMIYVPSFWPQHGPGHTTFCAGHAKPSTVQTPLLPQPLSLSLLLSVSLSYTPQTPHIRVEAEWRQRKSKDRCYALKSCQFHLYIHNICKTRWLKNKQFSSCILTDKTLNNQKDKEQNWSFWLSSYLMNPHCITYLPLHCFSHVFMCLSHLHKTFL